MIGVIIVLLGEMAHAGAVFFFLYILLFRIYMKAVTIYTPVAAVECNLRNDLRQKDSE